MNQKAWSLLLCGIASRREQNYLRHIILDLPAGSGWPCRSGMDQWRRVCADHGRR